MNAITRDGMPNRDYHRTPGVSATDLKMLHTMAPAKYHYMRSQPSEHKPAFDLGSATHSMVLEHDLNAIVKVDAESWRSKAAQEARDAAYQDGKTPLLPKDYDRVVGMCDAVMTHPLAKVALQGHAPERSIFWDIDGLPAKCRPDAITEDGRVIDLKTTVDASPDGFSRAIAQYGYHIQQAHYVDGMKALTGERPPFIFLAVEKEPPYLVGWYELDAGDVDRGREAAAASLAVYRECKETGNWPGYPTAQEVGLPNWARFQHDESLQDEMEVN